jgi:predicted TIM-barrel fold metal-dependent hydrolase
MNKKDKNCIRKNPTIIAGILITKTESSSGTNSSEEYCTEADFKKMNKIDAHCHINSDSFAFMNQALEDNFRILTINVDAPLGVTVREQMEQALYQIEAFPHNLAFVSAFSMEGWKNEDWLQNTMAYLQETFENGAIGVKVWKNIGMVERYNDGRFIMIDDEMFDPIFSYLEEKDIPLVGHLGEPRNCWLPLEEMTVHNDKEYFKDNPEYHMYLHPEFPSYEDQINARDRMLEKHPRLKYMGAHLGSIEWSVDELAKHFDRFPNSRVDLAERMCHIQAQAIDNPEKVHDFFIKYQDRIIYGTDRGDYLGSEQDPVKLKALAHTEWLSDWKFLTTDETMSSWKVEGDFKGLKLPRTVIEKIYFRNAENLFPHFKNL